MSKEFLEVDPDVEDFLSATTQHIKRPNEIKIDTEFKGRLWRLDEAEYENLKQSLIKEGCRDPLLLWNGILVDGHNRYEICTNFHIEYRTIEKHFDNKNEVFKWIDNNQLSRRNLLDWQRTILLGRLSKVNKVEGFKGNRFTENVVGDKMSSTKNQETIAKDLGVNVKTLQRAEKYVDVYEDVERNVGKEKADELANKLTKQEFMEVGKLNPFEQDEVISKLDSGTKYKSGTSIVKEVRKEKHFNERKASIETAEPSIETVKMFNDDCRNVLKNLPDSSIDMVLTDPPYAIDFVSSWKASGKETFNDTKDDIIPLLNDVCKLLQVKCKPDAHLYFFSSWMSYTYFEDIISKYFDISNVLIWAKNNTSLVDFDKRYGFSYEQIIFCKQKGNNDRMLKNRSSKDVLNFNRIANPDHTCEKPVDLLEYLIDNSTVKNELVVDCFAGTFNTMVAAKKLDRSYIGIEISEDFFKKGEMK